MADPLAPSFTADAIAAGIAPFGVARLPRIDFGAGRISGLPDAVARHGRHALIVTGRRSLGATGRLDAILAGLVAAGIVTDTATASGEPSPASVDAIVAEMRPRPIDVVVGIGGGSVLDTAKAVAGLLRSGTSARDHLEGVGRQLPYPGPPTPFIAVPTTAGTGSEATKNAVLSEVGRDGFKRSFRDERLVAAEAIVDPDLLEGAPPSLIAANGMDAVTQLLESYVSTRASPFTDALALSGLASARDGLLSWHAAASDAATAVATAAGATAAGGTTARGTAADRARMA
ncbi:MAG TPA: iron-containing alcohol dehydrogenase [Candidatus Dormibacteraeota bacterium]|nr:iron-containing alcohol dehydrogenase [Candidatus Dormibacteraeota bacterium]